MYVVHVQPACGYETLVSTSNGNKKRSVEERRGGGQEKITAYIRNFPANDVRMW